MKHLILTALALGVALAAAPAQAQQPAKLFFENDIVRHAVPGQQGPWCVLSNLYKRKEAVAFRIRVLQPSGATADASVLKSVVVELGNGSRLPAKFGPHGNPPTDHFWSLNWVIPADFPTGTLGYKIHATMNDGSVVTWAPFNRSQTALTVVEGEPVMAAAPAR
jgi:hypothetical protein